MGINIDDKQFNDLRFDDIVVLISNSIDKAEQLCQG